MLPLILISLAGCAVETIFIIFEYRKEWTRALLLKTAASLLFLTVGLFAYEKAANLPYARLVFAGLALGAAGDVCLNLRHLCKNKSKLVFMLGIAAFLLGHIFYVAALAAQLPRALIYAVPACAIVGTAVIVFVLRRVQVEGTLRTFGVIYLAVVMFMACLAVTVFVLEPASPAHLLFALGGLLFAASDMLLVLGQFGKRAYPSFRAMNLSLYYVGQILIALTIALMQ